MFFGNGMKVFRIKHIGVVRVDFANTQFICGHKHLAVGYPFCHPKAACAFRAGCHFYDPAFFCIPDGQCFARTVVAIGLNKMTDQFNGFACFCTAFRRYAAQFGAVENKFARYRFGLDFGSVGALAEHKLMFIHDSIGTIEVCIGMFDLGNKTKRYALRLTGIDISRATVGTGIAPQHISVIFRSVAQRCSIVVYRPE